MGYNEEKQRQLDMRYLRMARIWAENSYCVRRKVGALIVKDKMIISDGYNGTPSGFENVCEDENGKTNLALADVDGEVLVVSQFTLFADCRHGRRPSFTDAGAPDVANELYEYFLTLVAQDVEHVAHGIFGADMKVDLVNDGPFTIVLDTDNL